MPTSKEYRRLSREGDKHRVLFRGMAKWKAAQERGEDLPVGDFTAVTLEDVVPGKQTVTFGVSDSLDPLRIAIPQGIIDRIDPASHRTESIGYLQDNFVTNCDIHGAVIGQCKQCFKLSDDE